MKSETVSLQNMLDHEQKLRQESEIHARDSLATRAKAPPGLGDVERVMEVRFVYHRYYELLLQISHFIKFNV